MKISISFIQKFIIIWGIAVAVCISIEYLGNYFYSMSGFGIIVAIMFLPLLFKDLFDNIPKERKK